MKTVIQLAVAGLVILACVRAGEATWRYYQFKDAVEQEVRFGGAKTTSQLHRRVMELAGEHDVAVEYDNVTVESGQGQTAVAVHYVEPITLVPAFYTRQHRYDFEVSVHVSQPLIGDER